LPSFESLVMYTGSSLSQHEQRGPTPSDDSLSKNTCSMFKFFSLRRYGHRYVVGLIAV